MRGAVLVAVSATVGNFLQGWDAATIAGAIIYIKKELNLSTTLEGLVVALSLIGATAITTISGSISDWIGRRPMLVISAVMYFISGLVMLWSPNVYVLCVARLLDGFGVGLAVTLLPLYISETAPSEIRGMLNTLPQFCTSIGMFLSYCMTFGMSLTASPSWRLMLGILSIPSLIYLALAIFYLPESPRWLVSKGKMLEAKLVLQRLRGREDVSGEMALLVEGLAVGGEASIEEYIIGPAQGLADGEEPAADRIMLPEEDVSLVAKPVTRENSLSLVSRQGSLAKASVPLMDPLVTLFGSVHEKLPETGSTRSMLFPNLGSMFGTTEPHIRDEQPDEENPQREGEDYASESTSDSDNDLRSPLILRQHTGAEKASEGIKRHGTMVDEIEQSVGSIGIGSGWQLAWKWSEKENEDGNKEGAFKRIYFHEEVHGSLQGSIASYYGSNIPAEPGYVDAAALVSESALSAKELGNQHIAGPAMVHPSKTGNKVAIWTALLEPGVKRALIVGIGIQILQQFSGISGVFAYSPQLLEEAGVEVLLGNLGISSASASLLISAFTSLLMIPSVGVGMWLMDLSGRRQLLLTTIPLLILSLVILIISQNVNLSSTINAAISTICVIAYTCFFVTAFGPIPNILCSEIFPTRVRGICIAICAMAFWFGDIIITYTVPVLLHSLGLTGIFAIYAVFCFISWFFVFLKVPETKGMPLEVITEFFSVGAKHASS